MLSTAAESTTCSITNSGFAIEGAHIMPREEVGWYRYKDNNMRRYGVDPPTVDSKATILTLRMDYTTALIIDGLLLFQRDVRSTPKQQFGTSHTLSHKMRRNYRRYTRTFSSSLYIRTLVLILLPVLLWQSFSGSSPLLKVLRVLLFKYKEARNII